MLHNVAKGANQGEERTLHASQDHLQPFKISSILQTKKRHETRLKSCLSSAPPPRKNPGSTLSNLFHGIELVPTLIAFNNINIFNGLSRIQNGIYQEKVRMFPSTTFFLFSFLLALDHGHLRVLPSISGSISSSFTCFSA